MGDYDIPALTDYILNNTGFEKLAYIGHSQGNTQIFYAMSHKLAYFQEKWSLYVALAPPV